MKITILAVGSRGDCQPFVALGAGLKACGYAVRVGTHGVFEELVRGAGLEFAPLEGNPQDIVQGEEGREWLESSRNIFRFADGFRRLMGPVIRQGMQDALVAAEGSDAIVIAGPAYYFAHSVAQKLGVPMVQAYLQPVHPTGDFPSALFPISVRAAGR